MAASRVGCARGSSPVHCFAQYDQDVTTWSPQGRVHQVEYAMEAVKQGSAAVGLKVGACTSIGSTAACVRPLHSLWTAVSSARGASLNLYWELRAIRTWCWRR